MRGTCLSYNLLHHGCESSHVAIRRLYLSHGLQHACMLCIASFAAHRQCGDGCLVLQSPRMHRSYLARGGEKSNGGQSESEPALGAAPNVRGADRRLLQRLDYENPNYHPPRYSTAIDSDKCANPIDTSQCMCACTHRVCHLCGFSQPHLLIGPRHKDSFVPSMLW